MAEHESSPHPLGQVPSTSREDREHQNEFSLCPSNILGRPNDATEVGILRTVERSWKTAINSADCAEGIRHRFGKSGSLDLLIDRCQWSNDQIVVFTYKRNLGLRSWDLRL
jgi:hypothetical protein